MNPLTALGRLLSRSRAKKGATPAAGPAPVPLPPPPTRESCTARQGSLDGTLVAAKAGLDALATTPAPVTAAYDVAADAQAKAKAAVEADPQDWPAATTALDTFEHAVAALKSAAVAEATATSQGLATRYDAVKDGVLAGTGHVKARVAYGKDKGAIDRLIAGGDGIAALAACPAADVSLTAFEAVADPSSTDRQQTSDAARTLLATLDDTALRAKTATERAELAFDLCAKGQPSSGGRLADLVRVYRNSPPEPAFLAKRDAERAAIVEKVSKLPALAKLVDKKGQIDRKDWTKLIKDQAKVKALMQDISDAQAEALGLPKLVMTTFTKPKNASGVTMGGCEWTAVGAPTLNMNVHPDAVSDPTETLISILHETYHAQQDILVKRLKAGDLAATDPLYPQVLLFAANRPSDGYLPPEVDQADYEAQPIEVDAETQGNATATAVLLAMKTAKTGKKGKK